MKKGIALVLGSEPEEEAEMPDHDADDGIVIAASILKAIKASDAAELYESLCALEDHLHMMYREEDK